MTELSVLVRSRIEELRLSQAEAAERIGVSPSLVSRVVNGRHQRLSHSTRRKLRSFIGHDIATVEAAPPTQAPSRPCLFVTGNLDAAEPASATMRAAIKRVVSYGVDYDELPSRRGVQAGDGVLALLPLMGEQAAYFRPALADLMFAYPRGASIAIVTYEAARRTIGRGDLGTELAAMLHDREVRLLLLAGLDDVDRLLFDELIPWIRRALVPALKDSG